MEKQTLCHRRPRNSLGMAAADGASTTQKDVNAAASAGTEASSASAAGKEGEGGPAIASAVDGDNKRSKSTTKVRK